uniref:Uncharacterized protein n=1 Tax=Panagrolaimus sp. PS1159 TaxID=55785 RepID=A0AC35GAU6_9BILA
MWKWLHYYPVLNLRFILRFISLSLTFALIAILCAELFHPVEDLLGNSGTIKQAFGGTECEDFRGRLRLPSDMWNIYTKILGLVYSIWLFYKISVIFFPLFYGNWLYEQQEKLYTYRTGIIIVAGFNFVPLLFIGIFDCFYGRYFFCIAPPVIIFALVLDRLFVHADDYFHLFVDTTELIPKRDWQERLQPDTVSTKQLADIQPQPPQSSDIPPPTSDIPPPPSDAPVPSSEVVQQPQQQQESSNAPSQKA